MLIILEQKCQELCQAIEQVSERQDLLARLEKMWILQEEAPDKTRRFFWKDLQEQRFKEELDLLEKKHKLETLKKERERARVLKRKEMPVVTGAVTSTTSCSLSHSFEPNGEMSTPSKDELSLDREKSWWNADLEGRMDKLAVKCAVKNSARGSKNLDGKTDRWSAGVTITKRKME